MTEYPPSPARPGECVGLRWAVDPNLVAFFATDPAGFLAAPVRVDHRVPLACQPYSILPWWSYPSLLTRRLVRPYPVKVLFEWTAASASYQARDAASAGSHQ
jgi:hypothetical protein